MNNLLNKKSVLISFVVLVLFIGGTYLYYSHQTKTTQEEKSVSTNKLNMALSDIFETASSKNPNLDEEIALIQISQSEEDVFLGILDGRLNDAGIQTSKEELKICCSDLLNKVLKVIKLQSQTKTTARDMTRKADLETIKVLMEMYSVLEGHYLQSKTMPAEIGIDSVPTDPVTHNPYNWLDNAMSSETGCNGKQYCAWAELENGDYYIVSEIGSVINSIKPTNCPCVQKDDNTLEVNNEPKLENVSLENKFGIITTYPTSGQTLQKGKEYNIKWDYSGFEGVKVKICLFGNKNLSNNSQKMISAIQAYKGDCPAYQIASNILMQSGVYNWQIPTDIAQRFEEVPDVYKIRIFPVDTYDWYIYDNEDTLWNDAVKDIIIK